ncbi:hypothetical protein A3Q56_06977, partial [Intoshia linei]
MNREKLKNILVLSQLMILYTLQFLPMGFFMAFSYIFQKRHMPLQNQAYLNMALWPFTIKILWGPIVDGLKLPFFGRRKSWIIPSQLCISLCLAFLAYNLETLLGNDEINFNGNINGFIIIFFIMNFMASLQDISLDGWCVTILSEKNKSIFSISRSMSKCVGFVVSVNLFFMLTSRDLINNFKTFMYGATETTQSNTLAIISIQTYLYILSAIIFITAICFAIFKKEKDIKEKYNLKITYLHFLRLLKHKPILKLIVIHLISKIPFLAAEKIALLRLIDAGILIDIYSIITLPLIFVNILLSYIFSRFAKRLQKNPLILWLNSIVLRSFLTFLLAISVHYVCLYLRDLSQKQAKLNYLHDQYGLNSININKFNPPKSIYVYMFMYGVLVDIFQQISFLPIMSFHSQISDVLIGGSFMTLINTACDFGGMWIVTLSLWLIGIFSRRKCQYYGIKK